MITTLLVSIVISQLPPLPDKPKDCPPQTVVHPSSGSWAGQGAEVQLVGLCRADLKTGPVVGFDGKPLSPDKLKTFVKHLEFDKLSERPWRKPKKSSEVVICVILKVKGGSYFSWLSQENQIGGALHSVNGWDIAMSYLTVPKGKPASVRTDVVTGPYQTIGSFDEQGVSDTPEIVAQIEKHSQGGVEWTQTTKKEFVMDSYQGRLTIPEAYSGFDFQLETNDPKVKSKDPTMAAGAGAHQFDLKDGKAMLFLMGMMNARTDGQRRFTLKAAPRTRVVFTVPVPK